MTAKAPTPQPEGVVRPPAPNGPPNKWNFEDTKIDTISFPRGLTREQRMEYISMELDRYDREKKQTANR